MLKNSFTHHLLFLFVFIALSGQAWEFEENITLEGVLKPAERTIIKSSNGEKEINIEKSIVLITDKPLALSHSVTIGTQQIASEETLYPHIEVYLPEEFISLIGKRVQCFGNFRQSLTCFEDKIILDIDTALDCEQPVSQLKTVCYEPEEVELSGLLREITYPGPPEYTSINMGDHPEKVVILMLKNPINVEIKDDDNFNAPEKGVRELQVVFSDTTPLACQMKEEITLKGTLYHAHTAHHHRRVLMFVRKWKA